ncbi:hypothetical protein HPG69_007816 [Diceros bicornis minor]|uniref:Uncharacterized protein n=1 Tax=Diceros bicornis minor TaxID=77932 RepID=A0A7J7EB54_DICBM|nr:hypothetical protein HPG69_007816 [Diceros bicornis minor]
MKGNKFSPCAWKVVRGETEVCLSLMEQSSEKSQQIKKKQLTDLEACLTQEVRVEETPLMNEDSTLALEELETCLVQVMGEEESVLGMEGPTLTMMRYFQAIHLYLKEEIE